MIKDFQPFMQGTEEITHMPEILRFESINKNLLMQYLILQDGVIICYAYGCVDSQSIREAHDHLIYLLGHVKKDRTAQSFDMIIDFNNITWIDKNARSYLKETFSEFFKKGDLRHLGIISENYIVRTMGGLWAKLSPWMNYSFYKSEINAYQEILKKRVSHAKRANEESIALDLIKENIVFYRGIKLLIFKKKGWEFKKQGSNTTISLINSKILHIAMSGEVTNAMVEHSANCVSEAYELLNKEKLELIFEVSRIKFPKIQVRKFWFLRFREISDFWDHRFIVANPMVSAIFKIERISKPDLMERTELSLSVAHALDTLLNLSTGKKDKGPKETKQQEESYDTFSKKRLIEEIHILKNTQGERIQQLFEMLSKITWDDEFKPHLLKVPENDTFIDLFNAVNVIQYDFFGMVQQLKDWTQNLEQKVRERTSLLNARNVELTQLNEELDHFVYCVSHDLRAPLSSIQGLINLINMEQEENYKGQYLELVSKNIKRLDLFIQEILHLSRNARLVVNKETIEFQKIIDNTFAELVYLVEDGGIQKNIYIEQGIPFVSDAHRITVIFRNLLSNAIKYSINKHKVPQIDIKIKVHKDQANLEITDNGMGIMKEHLEKVFDMFYRATDINAGSGLGLYIVKQVINKMEGDIELSSQVGKGTQVKIRLPNLA